MNDPIDDLIHYASLAPSGHNAQPWKFHRSGDSLEILPDFSRRLPVVDPDDRELFLSLGCALENLLGAAAATGFAASPDIFPAGLSSGIRIALRPAEAQENPQLLAAMQERQCTRSLYDGKPIPEADWQAITNLAPKPGVILEGYRSDPDRQTWISLVREANLLQFADKAFRDELIAWIRFNAEEAQRTRDGLSTACTGNPSVPRWLGTLFLGLSSPQSVAEADEKKLLSSPAFALISSTEDDPTAWVRTGQVCQRFALAASARRLKLAFHNQPVEVPLIRSQVQETIAAQRAYPQLFLRLGYAQPMPVSLRRPLAEMSL